MDVWMQGIYRQETLCQVASSSVLPKDAAQKTPEWANRGNWGAHPPRWPMLSVAGSAGMDTHVSGVHEGSFSSVKASLGCHPQWLLPSWDFPPVLQLVNVSLIPSLHLGQYLISSAHCLRGPHCTAVAAITLQVLSCVSLPVESHRAPILT